MWRLRIEQEATRKAAERASGLSPMQVRTRERQMRAAFAEWLATQGFAVVVLVSLGWRTLLEVVR